MDDRIREEKFSKILMIVDEVLDGHPDPIGLMKTWPMPKGPFLPEEEDLHHVLDHYSADGDIRKKCEEYTRYQTNEVRRQLAQFLKANKGKSN